MSQPVRVLKMFEFAQPWMFVILPLPLMVYWLMPVYKESQDSIRVPFFQRLVELTGQKPSKGAVVLPRVLFQKIWIPLTWVLLVLAIAKPEWVGEPVEQTRSARDLMVAVDLSGSMDAKDFLTAQGKKITRLAAVKLVLKEFSAERKNDRLGLIVFGDTPYLQAP
ncbi:MAG: VWA domain-containing protein, partial [Thiohalomonadales bacterium]